MFTVLVSSRVRKGGTEKQAVVHRVLALLLATGNFGLTLLVSVVS